MMSQKTKKTLEITSEEGAIVFRDGGLEFYYPENGDVELRETFEFLMFAMIKQDWLTEWYAHLDAAEALADLAGKQEPSVPELTVIEGGKPDDT